MALTLVAPSYALFIRWMRGKLKGEMPASNQIRELELQHLGNHKPSPHLYLPHRVSFGAITLLTLEFPLYRSWQHTLVTYLRTPNKVESKPASKPVNQKSTDVLVISDLTQQAAVLPPCPSPQVTRKMFQHHGESLTNQQTVLVIVMAHKSWPMAHDCPPSVRAATMATHAWTKLGHMHELN